MSVNTTSVLLLGTAIVIAAVLHALITSYRSHMSAGDRVRLSGGHEAQPEWLRGESYRDGEVTAFIAIPNGPPAAVVRLDEPLTIRGVTSVFLLMHLRHIGTKWTRRGNVHLELLESAPFAAFVQPNPANWIESEAKYHWLRRRE